MMYVGCELDIDLVRFLMNSKHDGAATILQRVLQVTKVMSDRGVVPLTPMQVNPQSLDAQRLREQLQSSHPHGPQETKIKTQDDAAKAQQLAIVLYQEGYEKMNAAGSQDLDVAEFWATTDRGESLAALKRAAAVLPGDNERVNALIDFLQNDHWQASSDVYHDHHGLSTHQLTPCQVELLARENYDVKVGADRSSGYPLLGATLAMHYTPAIARKAALAERLKAVGMQSIVIERFDKEELSDPEITCFVNHTLSKLTGYTTIRSANSLSIKFVAALNYIITNNVQHALLLEDDVFFLPKFAEKLPRIMEKELPQDYDLVMLGTDLFWYMFLS
jgi:hypothetical protein